MLSRLISSTLVLFFALLISAAGQEGRVIIADSTDKELKRTAHRMRISAERLRSLRDALQQATNLARGLDPIPAHRMNQLGHLWLQLDRSKATASIESMMNDIRSYAEGASNLGAYQQSCFAFQGLLQPLMQLDPDKAEQMAHQWPRPPQSLGENAPKLRDQQIDQYQRQFLQQLAYQDPEKAARLYDAIGPFSRNDYSFRGQLAQQLAQAGQKDQAYKLVDSVIAEYGQRNPGQNSLQEFTSFLQNVASLDSDRFLTGLNLISKQVGQSNSQCQGNWTMTMGDKSVPLSPFEHTMLQLLRGSFHGRPTLLLKTLDALPDLKVKLDSFGGIDSVLNPGLSASGGLSFSRSSAVGGIGAGYAYSVGREARSVDKVSALLKELKGKAKKSPELVRQKLSGAINSPDEVELLINLAQRASDEDPDLSPLALEAAKALVRQIESLEKRSYALQSLVRVYRSCDGEVDTNLLRDGFILADQLRQAEKEKNPELAARRKGNTAADQLEQAMIAEYAVDNFTAAMKYLHAMPDGEAKLATYLRVMESLRQNY